MICLGPELQLQFRAVAIVSIYGRTSPVASMGTVALAGITTVPFEPVQIQTPSEPFTDPEIAPYSRVTPVLLEIHTVTPQMLSCWLPGHW